MKMARGYYLLWRSLTWIQGEFSLFLSCQTALMLLYCADAGNRKQSRALVFVLACLCTACIKGGDSNV